MIHVVDMHAVDGQGHEVVTPCNPIEQAPLLPTSAETPQRVVFASKVAAAPVLTPDFKRYLYATDVYDWSAMVFDISTNSTTRRPLERAHKEWNPFQPRDRIKFAAPPADLVIVQHDLPAISPVTGVAPTGVLCNPNPGAVSCIPSDTFCDLGTSYRTSPDWTLGAGPLKLRGEFAFAALTNGKLAVIDIADFDAPCRTPAIATPLAGCATQGSTTQITAQDISCNVVAPNQPRDDTYEAVGSQPGNHVPGIQQYPLLFAADGSNFAETATATPPIMVATFPEDIPAACLGKCDPLACGITCDTLPGCPLQIFVGGVQTPLDLKGGQCTSPCQDGTACTSDGECCANSTCSTRGVCRPNACGLDRTACTPQAAGSAVDPNCNSELCEDCGMDGTTPCSNADGVSDKNCSPSLCTSATTWGSPSINTVFTPGLIQGSNGLAMNLEDPRAQITNQNWTVTFEGLIPGFDARLAALVLPDMMPSTVKKPTLIDPNSRFCDNGVLGENAFIEMLTVRLTAQLTAQGLTPTEAAAKAASQAGSQAPGYADYVQIISDIPNPEDTYWTELAGIDAGDKLACNYAECLNVFGPIDAPDLDPTRDLRITEAYEDHVELEVRHSGSALCAGTPCSGQCLFRADGPNAGAGVPNTCVSTLDEIKCCFPSALTFTVRTGRQWSVVGDQSGFLHHVVADASTGVCRNACDPAFARRNSRLVESVPSFTPGEILDRPADPMDPLTVDPSPSFINPMFRFAVVSGQQKCAGDADCTLVAGAKCDVALSRCVSNGAPVTVPTPRNAIFRFTTTGAFVPMLIPLSADGTSQIEPQSITYLGPTTEVAVCDGSVNGLIFVSLLSPAVSRSFF